MPYAAPRVCSCGSVVASGKRCACEIVRDRDRKARHDQTRPTANERGYGAKWREARAAFLTKHPRCEMCDQPATVVDHKTPHKGNMRLFWDRSNWQGLCAHHHNSTKQRMERTHADI